MSARRSWVARLSGGRTASATQPPSSRPEPGPTRPVRAGPPERNPLPGPGPGPQAGAAVPEPRGPALRVVLVSRDKMLAGALRSLIEAPGGVRLLDWHANELDAAIRHADVVVVDMPPDLHERTFAVIDGRFLGRTVVLLQEGEHAQALPSGPPRVVLYRPLQIGELWVAITGSSPPSASTPPLPMVTGSDSSVPIPEPEPEAQAPEAPGAEGLDPDLEVADQPEPGPESDAQDSAAEVPDDAAAAQVMEGLPVSESGNLIGLSGRELEPVIGPGQIAPGMDEATLELLRGWRYRTRDLAENRTDQARPDRRHAREASRQAKSAGAEARKAARAEARQARAAQTAVRRAESRQARTARAQARAVAREEAGRAKAARGEERSAARAESAQARSLRRAEARQAQSARAETRRVAREEAGRARSARAASRREEAARAKVTRAEARAAARTKAEHARAVRAEETQRTRAARAETRTAARAEAGRARAARAEQRTAARAEAGQAKAARAEERKLARQEAERAKAARGTAAGGVARRALVGVARPAVVVVLMAAVGLVAAGWRGDRGPDTLAGEVAAVRAAGSAGGGLVVQDPRIGPIEPLHALAVGAWLRATGAEDSLEAAIQAARVPSQFLLGATIALSVLLTLLLMRVGPGTGAAAGPGPAPPHGRFWRLGVAGLVGVLVALDPLLVRGGRVATGTVLALALALGTLALAWALPARPALRWLAPVAAGSGLALLMSPLALPVLAVPTVAALLEGRHQDAWRTLAALGLGAALWLALPIWVASQELGTGQAAWLLGRPPGRGSLAGSLAAFPLSWLLLTAGLAAAIPAWRHRSGARPGPTTQTSATRLFAWVGTTTAGALLAMGLGYPVEQALPFALPAAAVAVGFASGWAVAAVRGNGSSKGRRAVLAGVGVALVGLVAAQGIDWGQRYGGRSDDGLGRLVATVGELPDCSAINAGGPDDRSRLLDAGATVTNFSSGPAAHAAGVRYFVLTPAARGGASTTPALRAWVRQHGERIAGHASPSYSRVELWRVDAGPLDPVADNLPVSGGIFSNVRGSACGGYPVVDGQPGAFHTAYSALGGKAVLGRPLGSVWTSDGPALQAFDTMVLGATPTQSGQPTVRPIELPPLLAKLDAEAVADADIPLPSVRAPATDTQARTLLNDRVIARAYLGTNPATASAEDWRRARDRFGRPLGKPQVMADGAVRQPFERVVLERPADGGPPRVAALGRLAVRLGLVPQQARQLEPVPSLPARQADSRVEPGPLLRLVAAGLVLLALGTGAGALAARRRSETRTGEAVTGR